MQARGGLRRERALQKAKLCTSGPAGSVCTRFRLYSNQYTPNTAVHGMTFSFIKISILVTQVLESLTHPQGLYIFDILCCRVATASQPL
jgi:hypothetical protein